MKKSRLLLAGLFISFAIGFIINPMFAQQTASSNSSTNNKAQNNLKLGAFSISLSVKDLKISRAFYEKLGFSVFAGSEEQNYLIMKNDNALIGLFQGMFQGNILTFNPGWDENANNIENFIDIREIQRQLINSGLKLISETDEKTAGPASVMLSDPDGNMILLDQHR